MDSFSARSAKPQPVHTSLRQTSIVRSPLSSNTPVRTGIPVGGCYHPGHSLARNIGSADQPRVSGCGAKGPGGGAGMSPVPGVVEELEPSDEMPLDAGEVAALEARVHLERMRHAETGGSSVAKCELKRWVCKRTSGRYITSFRRGHAFRDDQIDELRQVAGSSQPVPRRPW